jgi:hypothetical protein
MLVGVIVATIGILGSPDAQPANVCWRHETIPPAVAGTKLHVAMEMHDGVIWATRIRFDRVHLFRHRPGESWVNVGTTQVRGEFAGEIKMAIADGYPIVAYASMQKHVISASFLRWQGEAFEYLGAPVEVAARAHGIMHIGLVSSPGGDIYASWEEVGVTTSPRVVHWRAGRWHDVGPSSVGGKLPSADPALALDADGHPWLAWNDPAREPGKNNTALRIAQYDGANWHDVDVPFAAFDQRDVLESLGLYRLADDAMALVIEQTRRKNYVTMLLTRTAAGWSRESPPIETFPGVEFWDSSIIGGRLALTWSRPHEGATQVEVAIKTAKGWETLRPVSSVLRLLGADVIIGDEDGIAVRVINLSGSEEVGSIATMRSCE